MEVIVAETAGFCYGVQRAVDMVYDEIEEAVSSGKKVFTYGPIVHNENVVRDLAERGVSVIESPEELFALNGTGGLADASVIIRAHGAPEEILEYMKKIPGLCLKDATCPFVQNIRKTVRTAYGNGSRIFIAGDRKHPEVIGILSCIGYDAVTVSDADELSALEDDRVSDCLLVAQTTFNSQKFKDVIEIFRKKFYHFKIVDTICNATQKRQTEATFLSRKCDAMIVVGGRSSSNTAKLFDICRSECRNAFFVGSVEDLKRETLDSSVRCVGITAGASTPKTIIEEVLKYVRTEF